MWKCPDWPSVVSMCWNSGPIRRPCTADISGSCDGDIWPWGGRRLNARRKQRSPCETPSINPLQPCQTCGGQIWAKSGTDWSQVGQIRDFFISDLIWKYTGFVPFEPNLTHFWPKTGSRASINDSKQHQAGPKFRFPLSAGWAFICTDISL